jgi:hypothetical protein
VPDKTVGSCLDPDLLGTSLWGGGGQMRGLARPV